MTDDTTDVVTIHPEDQTAQSIATELASRLPEPDVSAVTTEFDDETASTLSDADILVTFELPDRHYEATDSLQWLHALTAGVDDYDVGRLRDDDVVVTNASGVNAEPVAEHTLGLMLASVRRIDRSIRQQERGEWSWYGGRELAGKTVGIVGVGTIGSRIAELCDAFEMNVLGVKRTPADVPPVVDEAFAPDELQIVLHRAEYVVLACPLTPQTRGMFGREQFEQMDDYAVLVNVARGEVVRESELVEALETDEIGGAALDVFSEEPLPEDSPLWDRTDVILTPHMAGSTPEYWSRNADLFAANYREFAEGNIDAMQNRLI